MTRPDDPLQRLMAAAREPVVPPPDFAAPPWFARSVVNRWLSGAAGAPAPAPSWLPVSRSALACALLIMTVSLAVNFRVVWHRDVPEQIASDAVVRLFLPR
jgi:hypothetical protein